MERLPDEVLLEILGFGRNPNLALVSRRLTLLLGYSEIEEMIIMSCCRHPRLHLAVHAQKALAGLFASRWFTMSLLYRHIAEWIWKQAEETIVNLIGDTDDEQKEARVFVAGAHCKGSSISDGFMQGWTICVKDKQVEVHVEYGQSRPSIQALAWDGSTNIVPDDRLSYRIHCFLPPTASGAVIPDRFLRGPWTQDDGDKFVFLVNSFPFSRKRWLDERQRALASDGLLQAIRDICFPAISLLAITGPNTKYDGCAIANRPGYREEDFPTARQHGPWRVCSLVCGDFSFRITIEDRHMRAMIQQAKLCPDEKLWGILVGKVEALRSANIAPCL